MDLNIKALVDRYPNLRLQVNLGNRHRIRHTGGCRRYYVVRLANGNRIRHTGDEIISDGRCVGFCYSGAIGHADKTHQIHNGGFTHRHRIGNVNTLR